MYYFHNAIKYKLEDCVWNILFAIVIHKSLPCFPHPTDLIVQHPLAFPDLQGGKVNVFITLL